MLPIIGELIHLCVCKNIFLICSLIVVNVHGNFAISKSFLSSLWKPRCCILSNVAIPMESNSLFPTHSIKNSSNFFIISLFKPFSPNFANCCSWCVELHAALKALSFVPTLLVVCQSHWGHVLLTVCAQEVIQVLSVTHKQDLFASCVKKQSSCSLYCFKRCSKLYWQLACTSASPEQTTVASILLSLTAWLIWYWSLSSASSCLQYKCVTISFFLKRFCRNDKADCFYDSRLGIVVCHHFTFLAFNSLKGNFDVLVFFCKSDFLLVGWRYPI